MNDFLIETRVYIEDTDAGGIVYYANYLRYMERARTEFFRQLGYLKPALFDGLQFVVRDVSIRYLKPAMLDDEITISAVLTNVSKFAFEMSQDVCRGSEVLVTASVKSVCIEVHSKSLARMPENMSGILRSNINM